VIAVALLGGLAWAGALPARADQRDDEQEIYSYVNKQGRRVYVNDPGRLPAAVRKTARAVDLSHISLNRKLGEDLAQAVDRLWSRLIGSKECRRARQLRDKGWFGQFWQDHGHLAVFVGALLVLAIITPWILRRIGAPKWSRLMLFVVPLLLMLAIITHAAVKTGQAYREISATAELCEEDSAEAQTTAGKADVIKSLRARLERTHRDREQAMERLVR
jgi:hypothetical protein